MVVQLPPPASDLQARQQSPAPRAMPARPRMSSITSPCNIIGDVSGSGGGGVPMRGSSGAADWKAASWEGALPCSMHQCAHAWLMWLSAEAALLTGVT